MRPQSRGLAEREASAMARVDLLACEAPPLSMWRGRESDGADVDAAEVLVLGFTDLATHAPHTSLLRSPNHDIQDGWQQRPQQQGKGARAAR